MFDIIIYCNACADGRTMAGITSDQHDDFEWDLGDPVPDEVERDPRLDWYIEVLVQWDQPLPTREDVGAWFRDHRRAVAEALVAAADHVPLGLTTEVVRWSRDFAWPVGAAHVNVAARNSYHARRLGDYVREFAAGALGGATPAQALAGAPGA